MPSNAIVVVRAGLVMSIVGHPIPRLYVNSQSFLSMATGHGAEIWTTMSRLNTEEQSQ